MRKDITSTKLAILAEKYELSNMDLKDPHGELKRRRDKLKSLKERKLPGDKELAILVRMKIRSLEMFLMEIEGSPTNFFARIVYKIKMFSLFY